jgi:hypothetical protein
MKSLDTPAAPQHGIRTMAMLTPETDTQTRRVCLNWDNQGNHVREVVFAELARKLESERDEARAETIRTREFMDHGFAKAKEELDEAHALLRRIATKGEFMDMEGQRITVADWLARRQIESPTPAA